MSFFQTKKNKSSNNLLHVILDYQKATLKSLTIEHEKLPLMVRNLLLLYYNSYSTL